MFSLLKILINNNSFQNVSPMGKLHVKKHCFTLLIPVYNCNLRVLSL